MRTWSKHCMNHARNFGIFAKCMGFGNSLCLVPRPLRSFEAGKSDFDFLVRFQPCTPAGHADHYFGLFHGLEDLLKSPVDLIEADAVTNTYFRQEVEATRVPLYAVESLLA